MRLRRLVQTAILALPLLAASACRGVDADGADSGHATADGSRGRAVVVYAAEREADARDVAARLEGIGLEVALEREGPPVRKRSSVAVYRIAGEAPLLDPAQEALEGIPDLEWLPSVHGGPPLTDVVVWLVPAGRAPDDAPRGSERD